jgi:hypothetical protein
MRRPNSLLAAGVGLDGVLISLIGPELIDFADRRGHQSKGDRQ